MTNLSIKTWYEINKMWYIHTMKSYSPIKRIKFWHTLQHRWPLKTCKVKKSAQKAICCMIPFIWNVQSRWIHRDRKSLQGLGLTAKWHRASFWSDEDALEQNSGDICTTPWMYKRHPTVYFKMVKMVNIILCGSFLPHNLKKKMWFELSCKINLTNSWVSNLF